MTILEKAYYVIGIVSAAVTGVSVIIALKNYLFNKSVVKIQKSIELLSYYKDNILNYGYAIRSVNDNSGMNKELSAIKISSSSMFNSVELHRFKIDEEKIDKIYKSQDFVKSVFEANNEYNLKLPISIVKQEEDKEAKQRIITFDMRPTCKTFMEKVVYETLNNLEYFASHFRHGVADETVAYNSLHQTYIPLVENLYYQIAQTNKEALDGYYSNVIYLYKEWKCKQDKAYKESDKISDEVKPKTTIIK